MKKITDPKAKMAPSPISALLLLCDNQENAEGQDRRHPSTDVNSVQFGIFAVGRKEDQHAEGEARQGCDQDGKTKNCKWFHATVYHILAGPSGRNSGKKGPSNRLSIIVDETSSPIAVLGQIVH